MNTKPLVSIGLPVYNGEKYLVMAIESLLAQDYFNFELIISDNASTDNTQSICHEYQVRDQRIRYYGNIENIGASLNFNKVFSLSEGKYFMWAAHDDLWESTYISKCVSLLESNPNVVLCSSEVKFINEEGFELSRNWGILETVGMDIPNRVYNLISTMDWYSVYGVFRQEILRQTRLCLKEFGSDFILLMEMVFMGEFAKIPEELFYYRVPDQPKTIEDYYFVLANLKESKKTPHTNMLREMSSVIASSRISSSLKEKVQDSFFRALSSDGILMGIKVLEENISGLDCGLDLDEVSGLIENVLKRVQPLKNPKYVKETLTQIVGARPVYIWGAGSAGKISLSMFNHIGVNIFGFIDKNTSLWNEKIENLSVYSPSLLEKDFSPENKPYIIISSSYGDIIKQELELFGYRHGFDYKQRNVNCPFLLLM